jgi:hypothetical protein
LLSSSKKTSPCPSATARDDGEPHTSQPPKFRVPSLIVLFCSVLFATRSRLARALSRHFS